MSETSWPIDFVLNAKSTTVLFAHRSATKFLVVYNLSAEPKETPTQQWPFGFMRYEATEKELPCQTRFE